MKHNKYRFQAYNFIGILILWMFCYQFTDAQSKQWIVPQSALTMKNPLEGNAASVNTGRTIYKTQCSACHGDKGKGDGPAAVALTPKPADHTSNALQAESDGSLFYKISEGRKPMPAFKNTLNENQRWAVINYMRTLQKK